MTATPGADPAVAERLRRRYPAPRVPRRLLVLLIGLCASVGLAWLVWAGYVYSNPTATSRVSGYAVRSDQRIDVILTVDRPDPSVRVTCRVVAQASDFQTVGEQAVLVPPGPSSLSTINLTLVTLRRPTTAVAKGCTSEG